VAELSGNPPGPLHALRVLAKTPLASDKIDVPAVCVTLPATMPFHFVHTAGGVVTRNVSEYMLVLALCLPVVVVSEVVIKCL